MATVPPTGTLKYQVIGHDPATGTIYLMPVNDTGRPDLNAISYAWTFSGDVTNKKSSPPIVKSESKDAILSRIRKFINLAANINQKEAERAAMAACALIRQHRLDVVDPDTIDQLYEQESTLKLKIKELEEAPRDDVYLPPSWGPTRASGSSGIATYSTQSFPNTSAPQAQPPMMTPVMMTKAKGGLHWAADCKHCGTRLNQGDEGLWQKNVGVWCPHTSCYQDWRAAQRGTPVTRTSPFTP